MARGSDNTGLILVAVGAVIVILIAGGATSGAAVGTFFSGIFNRFSSWLQGTSAGDVNPNLQKGNAQILDYAMNAGRGLAEAGSIIKQQSDEILMLGQVIRNQAQSQPSSDAPTVGPNLYNVLFPGPNGSTTSIGADGGKA